MTDTEERVRGVITHREYLMSYANTDYDEVWVRLDSGKVTSFCIGDNELPEFQVGVCVSGVLKSRRGSAGYDGWGTELQDPRKE